MVQKTTPQLELLRGETVLLETQPHVMAFYPQYLIWSVVVLVSLFWQSIASLLLRLMGEVNVEAQVRIMNEILVAFPQLNFRMDSLLAGDGLNSYAVVGLWLFFLLIYGVAVSVAQINFRYVLYCIVLGGLSVLVGTLLGSVTVSPLVGAVIGLFAMSTVEWYRRQHHFVITNFRIVTAVQGLGYQERELHFTHLSDLSVQQSWVGRMFNFGTLLPISDAGFGVGSDLAGVAMGVSNAHASLSAFGARSVTAPRARSGHALFGVPNPHHVHNQIEQLIHDSSAATQLVGLRDELRNKGESIMSASKDGIRE